jgi:hypothetical protein
VSLRVSFLRATAVALPLLIGLACGDDNNNPSTPTFLVQGADMGAQLQNVTVSNDGAPVSGATVTVNGEPATPGAAGEYAVTLAAPVAVGGALNLEVEASGETITATGNVPEAPAVTAPADAAIVLTTDAIDVIWASATDPERFVVLGVGATTETFDAAGTARAFTIPAGELAAGDWEIRVYAYNDGDFTGPTESGSAMNIRGEAAAYPSVTVVAAVLVHGSDMGNQFQHVSITQGGTVVDLATVTVNTEVALQSTPGSNYDVTLAAPVAAGGLLDLDIAFGSVVIEGTGAVPEPPVITAPLEGANIPVANAIDVTWTSTTDPDRFFINTTNSTLAVDLAGTARAYTIPAGTLPVGGPYQIRVYAYNDGTFTGPVDVTSKMSIRGEGPPQPSVTVIP